MVQFMISKSMVRMIIPWCMWVWHTTAAVSAMGPLLFIWSRGTLIWRTSWSWSSIRAPRRSVVVICSMRSGFLICSWSASNQTNPGRSSALRRRQVWRMSMATSSVLCMSGTSKRGVDESRLTPKSCGSRYWIRRLRRVHPTFCTRTRRIKSQTRRILGRLSHRISVSHLKPMF